MDTTSALLQGIRRYVHRVIADQPPPFRMAKVTATDATALTVTLDWGDGTGSTQSKYLSSYAPAVGDVVFVLVANTDVFVLGKRA